jgi:hypothetical protein
MMFRNYKTVYTLKNLLNIEDKIISIYLQRIYMLMILDLSIMNFLKNKCKN